MRFLLMMTPLFLLLPQWANAHQTSVWIADERSTLAHQFYNYEDGDPTSELRFTDTITHTLHTRWENTWRGRLTTYWDIFWGLGHGGIHTDKDWNTQQNIWSYTLSETPENKHVGITAYGRYHLMSVAPDYPLFLVGALGYDNLTRVAYGLHFAQGCHCINASHFDHIPINRTEHKQLQLHWGVRTEQPCVLKPVRFYQEFTLALPVITRIEDSHFLRDDLGPTPNIILKGMGTGLGVKLGASCDLDRHWKSTLEYRYESTSFTGSDNFHFADGTQLSFPTLRASSHNHQLWLGLSVMA